ncbi:MAG: SAM-dependent methyltransferase [bacterium]|nr:SAM-dependent methyltransferase [bacterium]
MPNNPVVSQDSSTPEDYTTSLKQAVCDEGFLRLTFSGKTRAQASEWQKVVVRPVALKGQTRVQFAYFDARQDHTLHVGPEESPAKLDELLALAFSNIHLQTRTHDLHVRITKKQKVLSKKSAPSRPEDEPDLRHNRVKRRPIADDVPDAFLQGVGIMDGQGRVRPTRRDKFLQINEFLNQLQQSLTLSDYRDRTLHIVDCGCGNAYLTFAAYHFLKNLQGIDTVVTGIDSNADVIKNCVTLRDELGWHGLEFVISRIADFVPPTPPDLVLSLHACDTATDDAIAQGVRWQSATILAAPCCQHELRSQVDSADFSPVLRHGILKQRTAEMLTDACRAQILRILGYRADIVEFIDSKHTPKNLLIRAVKSVSSDAQQQADAYRTLTRQWHILPCLETRLRNELSPYLT